MERKHIVNREREKVMKEIEVRKLIKKVEGESRGQR